MGVFVKFAAFHRDRGGVLREGESLFGVELLHGDHVVLGLLGAAGFGDHQMQRGRRVHHFKQVGEFGRIGVVEEVNLQIAVALRVGFLVPVGAVDRELHQLRAERGAADAVDHDRVELPAGFAGDFTGADLFGKLLDGGEKRAFRILDAVGKVGDLAVCIRVLDRSGFKAGHFSGGALEFRRELVEVGVGEFHPGESDGEVVGRVDQRIGAVAFDPVVHTDCTPFDVGCYSKARSRSLRRRLIYSSPYSARMSSILNS